MSLKECWNGFKRLWNEYVTFRKMDSLDVELSEELMKILKMNKKNKIVTEV